MGRTFDVYSTDWKQETTVQFAQTVPSQAKLFNKGHEFDKPDQLQPKRGW